MIALWPSFHTGDLWMAFTSVSTATSPREISAGFSPACVPLSVGSLSFSPWTSPLQILQFDFGQPVDLRDTGPATRPSSTLVECCCELVTAKQKLGEYEMCPTIPQGR